MISVIHFCDQLGYSDFNGLLVAMAKSILIGIKYATVLVGFICAFTVPVLIVKFLYEVDVSATWWIIIGLIVLCLGTAIAYLNYRHKMATKQAKFEEDFYG